MGRFRDATETLLKWVEEIRKERENDPVVLLMISKSQTCNGPNSRHLLPPNFDFDKSELRRSDWIDVGRSVEGKFERCGYSLQCNFCQLKYKLTVQAMMEQQECQECP